MSRLRTYLDYNASAPVRPQAAAAMVEALREVGNPSSVHRDGVAMRRRIDTARREVATLVGAVDDEIVFTSGGSEANGLALRGSGRVNLVVSAVEHISVLMTASYVDPGFRVVPVRGDGRIDLDALDSVLAGIGPSALLSLQWANNETGVVQPVAEAVAIAHRHGALIHVDAVQAAGKIEIDFAASAIDLLSLSAHKIGGPQGVGALVVRRGLAVLPMIAGGRQEGGHRAGTENVAGIVGFGVAATLSGQDAGSQRVSVWRDMIERQLESVAAIQVFAESSPRLGNTTCFATPGLAGETQVIALDLDGVSVSSGAACSSGKVEPSHVLRAMGVPDHVARSAIRVSLGWNSSEADAARFIDAWLRLWRRVHSVAAARAA